MFHLAQRWRAILVLENADAFLTQRSRNEAGTSAVTLAIRSMDSYTGILILTTSRVGDLDEAVWSYTDLAINFPPLRGERLQKVWGHSISEYKVKYYSRIMDFIEDICKTEGLEINGRDIRNITLAAQNLARHKNKVLEVQHIQAVLENRKEFMKYIQDLSGSDMAQRAMQMQIRNDAEPEEGKKPQTKFHTYTLPYDFDFLFLHCVFHFTTLSLAFPSATEERSVKLTHMVVETREKYQWQRRPREYANV